MGLFGRVCSRVAGGRRFAVVASVGLCASLAAPVVAGATPASPAVSVRHAVSLRHADPFGPPKAPKSPAPLFTGGPPTSSWQPLTHAPAFNPHHMLLLH